MKALSVRQPWASLIATGRKTIEWRTWRTNYRGPLAIHASATRMCQDDVEIAEGYGLAVEDALLGAIVATARLVDCREKSDIEGALVRRGANREGDGFGWILEDVRQLKRPIMCKGRLGLWLLPVGVAAALAKPGASGWRRAIADEITARKRIATPRKVNPPALPSSLPWERETQKLA